MGDEPVHGADGKGEEMEHKVKTMRMWTWEIYAITFVLTSLLFLSGIAIGYYFTSTASGPVLAQIESANDNMINMQLLLSSESDPSLFCSMYSGLSPSFENETWSIGQQLEFMEQSKKQFDPSLKFKYYQLEFRDLLLARDSISLCNDSLKTIIYIYSNKEGQCSTCNDEGTALWLVREHFAGKGEKLRIYSFDGSSEESAIVSMLKKAYNYSAYPTLIIDDKAYAGYRDENGIISIIEGT
jgi:hypothetical protein